MRIDRKKLLKSWPAFAAGALALVIFLVVFAERKLSSLVVGGLGVGFSTRMYSAPFAVDETTRQTPKLLLERLRRLRYAAKDRAGVPGEYRWSDPVLEIYLRGFASPVARQLPGSFRLTVKNGDQWSVESSSGSAAARVLIEPELVAELSGQEKVRRDPAIFEELPDDLKNAVVAVEDKRFFGHWGIDLRAMARSAWYDVTRRGVYGGSTITQQLAKNLFLTPRRTLRRKLMEAALSIYLELRYSKRGILTLYLNHIYLGQDGTVAVAGMKAAARFFFNKRLSELDLGECAMLAGLIRSPYLYNPLRFPDAATARRDFVLSRMKQERMIDTARMRAARRSPVVTRRAAPELGRDEFGYFTAEVVRRLVRRYPEDEIFRFGLSIHTTVDPLLQASAVRALRPARHQAALVAVDPASGRVLALVGGKDYAKSQFDRATQARRQPGSAFKPIVYGAALESGVTPATLLRDEPRKFPKSLRGNSGSWHPANYDGVYLGTVTVRVALARSLNGATLDLAQRVGMPKVVDFARRLGISSPLEDSLALALGASEVGLLELSTAYAPFVNGGFRVAPAFITAVSDAEGNVMEFSGAGRSPAIDPALAYLVTSLLESVFQEGTAKPVALAYKWDSPSAGKTGTTNDGRDAWFIGYTPRILVGVWAGEDSHKSVGATGAKDALPLWLAFMREEAPLTKEEFVPPQGGLVREKIDPLSGLRAGAGCPVRREEVFLAGTEPAEYCPLHARGVVGWFRRLFGLH